MEKTEWTLMISLDTLIDILNLNTEIKITELANWKSDAVAVSTVEIYLFPFLQNPLRELSFTVSSDKQEPHFLADRLHYSMK